jgi:cytochrome c-type biogenesis protein CcmH/NrfG
VVLNSDAKSEVEGLRWVLTRRAVMAVVFMAFMVLSSLRYSSYRSHQEALKQKEKEKKEEEEKVLKSRYKDVAVGEDGVPAGEMVLAANGLTQT